MREHSQDFLSKDFNPELIKPIPLCLAFNSPNFPSFYSRLFIGLVIPFAHRKGFSVPCGCSSLPHSLTHGEAWSQAANSLNFLSGERWIPPKLPQPPLLPDSILFFSSSLPGTPINRIPIMAKQILDLYMLYKLVTEKGGLVEIINKKIWREITKGLNLPTSITSAAFTLRTQ